MDDPDRAFAGLIEEMDHLTDSEMLELGHFATTMVVARTKHGIDVDGHPFKQYTEEYAETRSKRGLSKTPDLAVTGHMLGAMVPKVTGANEVSVMFLSPLESLKAAVHNNGVNSLSSVRSHSRNVYVNAKSGQRVSRHEAMLDQKRKNKKTAQRSESVGEHHRKMNTPQREFLDIRMDRELNVMAEAITGKILGRVEKSIK